MGACGSNRARLLCGSGDRFRGGTRRTGSISNRRLSHPNMSRYLMQNASHAVTKPPRIWYAIP